VESEESNPPLLAAESQRVQTLLCFSGEGGGWETPSAAVGSVSWVSQQLRWNDLFAVTVPSFSKAHGVGLLQAEGLLVCLQVWQGGGEEEKRFLSCLSGLSVFFWLVQLAVTMVSRERGIFSMLEGQSLLPYCFALE